MKTRREKDSLGELDVPASALYGAQTERARRNFDLSGRPLPRAFLRALGLLKAAAARAHGDAGRLPKKTARAIERAALDVAAGDHDAHFPLDVYQTGSGTSTNMNANEVIARLASTALGAPVHPNDHVNLGQSSNDVIPSALLVSAHLLVEEALVPALEHLRAVIDRRAGELDDVVKTGRTHLMDAMPLTFGQELGAWSTAVGDVLERLEEGKKRRTRLALGGTAVGSGVNADADFAPAALAALSRLTEREFSQAPNLFTALSFPDAALELAGTLGSLAALLLKISNDLRWMNSGPLAGLGEIELPVLQPGSSIMPGKVNPVIPEAVSMVALRVLGSVQSITLGVASGNFQLNVTLPLLANELVEGLELSARAARSLADRAIAGFTVRADHVEATLGRNPILVTALNARIGYEHGARIAKRAYAEGRPILDVAREETKLPAAELARLLDPGALVGDTRKKRARSRGSAKSKRAG